MPREWKEYIPSEYTMEQGFMYWVSIQALLQSWYLFAVFSLVCEIKLEALPLL